MSNDGVSRRLHPRLRVFRNGSAEVNACRAQISSVVASKQTEPEEEGIGPTDLVGLVEAQERAQSLDAAGLEDATGRLAARPKLADTSPASDAFVNVFIDVVQGREGEDEDAADDRIVRAVSDRVRGLLSREAGGLRGSIVRRENQIAAMVPVSALADLEEDENIGFVSVSEPLKLDIPRARSARRPRARKVGKRALHNGGAGVIVGIIDVGGFDFAHSDFLDKKGKTRFLAIWDQGGDFRDPPDRFGYGTEFRREHLNAALAAAKRRNGLPAVELERQSQRSPGSHGTHVASIAAGNNGVCPEAEIAAVLIDVPAPEDDRARRRFSFSDTSRITHAVEYLLDLAKQEQKSISINISLGTNGGAHDGSSGVSRWLDQALTTPGRAICVAAGNAGQEAPTYEGDIGWTMGRIHTSGRVEARGLEVEIEWTVVGNGLVDISENELEIWYGSQDRLAVAVKAPGEDRWYEAGPREYWENKRLDDGTTLSIFNELYQPANGANYIAIYLSPNLDPQNIRGIKAGVWKVRLRGEEIRDGRFHAWIERDDPVEIGRSARQRYFRFPSFFSRRSNVDSHSISSLACGQNVIAVANADVSEGRINPSSSQGPTRDGRRKPDIAASGTKIVAANGFSVDGREWVSMTGTSMASPYVAGVIGLMLAANPALTSAQCTAILQRTAQPMPGVSFEWQNDAGFGLLDPEFAIGEAANFTRTKELR